MRTVVIVQARMGSSRLPGKALAEVGGRAMLAHQLRRLKRCGSASDIVVATTTRSEDDSIIEVAKAEEVGWFRGSEVDVLGRMIGAAREARADLVVRCTGDCPLIDPDVVDAVVAAAVEPGCDYASNTLRRTYPRGLDTEALYRDALERAGRLSTSVPSREHVTYYLHAERPELFLLREVVDTEDNSDLRWTVDTEEDLMLVREIFAAAGLGERAVSYRDLVRMVRTEARLATINAHVRQRVV